MWAASTDPPVTPMKQVAPRLNGGVGRDGCSQPSASRGAVMRRAEDSAPYHLVIQMKPFLPEQSGPSAASSKAEALLSVRPSAVAFVSGPRPPPEERPAPLPTR